MSRETGPKMFNAFIVKINSPGGMIPPDPELGHSTIKFEAINLPRKAKKKLKKLNDL